MNISEYEEALKKAEDYMNGFAEGNLRYNNSAHRSEAKRLYNYALDEAIKSFGKESEQSEYCKRKIHFLNTG